MSLSKWYWINNSLFFWFTFNIIRYSHSSSFTAQSSSKFFIFILRLLLVLFICYFHLVFFCMYVQISLKNLIFFFKKSKSFLCGKALTSCGCYYYYYYYYIHYFVHSANSSWHWQSYDYLPYCMQTNLNFYMLIWTYFYADIHINNPCWWFIRNSKAALETGGKNLHKIRNIMYENFIYILTHFFYIMIYIYIY